MITYHTFCPGKENSREAIAAGAALDAVISHESPEQSFSQIMRFRLSGKAATECQDNYFIALDGSRCVSRVWYGFGNHPDAIGNFGNFRTAEDHQKMGIGRILLQRCFDDLATEEKLPLALFCSAGEYIAPVYRKYGFRAILPGRNSGPLYCPLAGSPENFDDFCQSYYHFAEELHFLPGGVGHRHEIDLLLKFFCIRNNLDFGLPSFPSYEAAFVAVNQNPDAGKLERIALADGRTVGWAFTQHGKEREIQLHPQYHNLL